MTQHSHQTAPTQFVNTAGVRFAYRRFGKSTGVPLVFNMHFTGTMDHWDPLVTDGLAATREVILFNNAGISSSSGEVPSSAEEMAANAAAFIKALGLAKVDVPWGGRHVGAAFFRDHVLPNVTDVFDFARFSYDDVVAEDGHVVAVFNIGVTGTDAIIKIVDHWTLRDGKAISLWAAYFEPQAVLKKLAIKLAGGGMNA